MTSPPALPLLQRCTAHLCVISVPFGSTGLSFGLDRSHTLPYPFPSFSRPRTGTPPTCAPPPLPSAGSTGLSFGMGHEPNRGVTIPLALPLSLRCNTYLCIIAVLFGLTAQPDIWIKPKSPPAAFGPLVCPPLQRCTAYLCIISAIFRQAAQA